MKKAIYFTTALPDKAREYLLNQGIAPNNPSNQNYHSRLIHTLGTFLEVSPICFSPYKAELPDTFCENILKNSTLWDHLISPKKAKRIGLSKDADFIFFDALNLSCFQSALLLKRKSNAKCVAVLTDDPNFISSVNPLYFSRFQSFMEKLKDTNPLAITLNDALADKMGFSSHFSLPFLFEEKKEKKISLPYPYLFYSGTLLPRFNFPLFLEAFEEWKKEEGGNSPLHLVYAGHHGTMMSNNKDIIYIGECTEEENISLMKGAALVLNPRKEDPELDALSIPSKVFEYLLYTNRIASSPHPFLNSYLKGNAYLFSSSTKEEFLSFLRQYMKDEESFEKLPVNHAQEEIQQTYAKEKVASSLQKYLKIDSLLS